MAARRTRRAVTPRRPVEGSGTTGLAKASRLLTDKVATVAQCGLDPPGRLSGTVLIRLDPALAVFRGFAG
jgi:hypothetical protein